MIVVSNLVGAFRREKSRSVESPEVCEILCWRGSMHWRLRVPAVASTKEQQPEVERESSHRARRGYFPERMLMDQVGYVAAERTSSSPPRGTAAP